MPRRAMFAGTYGTAKTQQGKGGAKLPAPMGSAPVPLSLAPAEASPQPQPVPPGPQRQVPGGSLPVSQDGSQVPPELAQMLEQLMAQLGGRRG